MRNARDMSALLSGVGRRAFSGPAAQCAVPPCSPSPLALCAVCVKILVAFCMYPRCSGIGWFPLIALCDCVCTRAANPLKRQGTVVKHPRDNTLSFRSGPNTGMQSHTDPHHALHHHGAPVLLRVLIAYAYSRCWMRRRGGAVEEDHGRRLRVGCRRFSQLAGHRSCPYAQAARVPVPAHPQQAASVGGWYKGSTGHSRRIRR